MPGIGIGIRIGGGGGAAKPIKWLEDLFTTDLAAGSVNGTLSEPSGHLRTVVDAENKLNLSGGYLNLLSKTSAAWGDPRIDYPLTVFSMGMVIDTIVKINNSGQIRFGFRYSQAFASPDAILQVGITAYFSNIGTVALTSGTEYNFRIVSGVDRIFAFIKGGTQYTNWTFLETVYSRAATNQYPSISNYSADINVNKFKLFKTALNKYAAHSVAINAAPWSLVQPSANAYIEFTWIAQTAETLDIAVRQIDATHRLILRGSQAGSTIKLIKDDGGETELISAAYTFIALSEYRFTIKLNGTSIICAINDGQKINTTSTFNQTSTGLSVSGFARGANLIAWPLIFADNDFAEISSPKQYNIFAYGDSKTAGTSDLSVNRGYVPLVCGLVNAMEIPARVGVGGMSTATAKTRIDADLAAAVGIPDYVLYAMGRNDTIDAAWSTNTAYILDAIHTKWPSAKIYCSVSWDSIRGVTFSNAQKAALVIIVATRSWALIGIEEVNIFENGDNGTTYLADGTHPNRLGYMLWAEAWKTALGL